MHLCYIDESGTPEIPGNSSHFILAGISIPIEKWKQCDYEIERIKAKYKLDGSEIHTAWLMRRYVEQSKILDFDNKDYRQRRQAITSYRNAEILRLQRVNKPPLLKQTKKNYKETDAYIHLTEVERHKFVYEIADLLSNWSFCRLFAECIDKVYYSSLENPRSISEQAFEQVVTRFEHYLQIISKEDQTYGLLIHDNNPTVAKRHTELMRQFHHSGTFWTSIKSIIETPLFVDSELTSMVQIADLCGYALRRYAENQENGLFDIIFRRADRKDGVVVGVRHFTDRTSCHCKICATHSRKSTSKQTFEK